MNNAKVTVTKEVAEALAIHAKSGVSVRTMLRHNVHGDLYGVYAPLQTMHVEELAKALLIGYTVEKSPEDKVREYYDRCKSTYTYTSCGGSMVAASFKNGQMVGASITLDILGIKIEGVNA